MKSVNILTGILRAGAGLSLLGMVFLTCGDVVGGVFGHPILGSEEIVGLMGTLLLAFALPVTHREKGHVGVELVYRLFPDKVKTAFDMGICLVSSCFFLVAAWQSYLYAASMAKVGLVSPTIKFPIHYVIYGVFLGCLVLAIVILAEFIEIVWGKKDE
jgi:TRAP-type C4-dicarboxylate transport system permease small subunit